MTCKINYAAYVNENMPLILQGIYAITHDNA